MKNTTYAILRDLKINHSEKRVEYYERNHVSFLSVNYPGYTLVYIGNEEPEIQTDKKIAYVDVIFDGIKRREEIQLPEPFEITDENEIMEAVKWADKERMFKIHPRFDVKMKFDKWETVSKTLLTKTLQNVILITIIRKCTLPRANGLYTA